jgi:deoxyribose-phosphate aldolase
MDHTCEPVAKMIHHSLVNPTLSTDQLEDDLAVALAYGTATVSITPFYLSRAAEGWTTHHPACR